MNLRSLKLDRSILKGDRVSLLANSVRQIEELYLGPGCVVEPINGLLQNLTNLTSLVRKALVVAAFLTEV